jgi:hypothetical protein
MPTSVVKARVRIQNNILQLWFFSRINNPDELPEDGKMPVARKDNGGQDFDRHGNVIGIYGLAIATEIPAASSAGVLVATSSRRFVTVEAFLACFWRTRLIHG